MIGVCYTMYCPRLEIDIDERECNKIQDSKCADCEEFEPFIWFMMKEEWKGAKENDG